MGLEGPGRKLAVNSIKESMCAHCPPWEQARPLQRSLGPFGPEMPKKSRKCLLGPLALEPPISLPKVSGTVWEVCGESPGSVERVFSDCSQDFLETFRGSGPEAPGDIFETFSAFQGPKGPRDLCKGRAGSLCPPHFDAHL